MRGRRETIANCYLNVHFLGDFSTETFFRGFALVNLPPRELPFKRETHYFTSLCGEDKTITFDNGASHMYMLHPKAPLPP